MGAAPAEKEISSRKIDLSVGYSSIYELNNQVNQLVIVQHELAGLAREKVPQVKSMYWITFWKQISCCHE